MTLTFSRRLIALAVSAALAFGAAAAGQAPASSASCAITTPERVVAVGDVHGGYEPFQAILRAAGLIDARRRWTGGRAILVQTGDLVDRGAESRQVLDLVRRLERDAARAGGRVHALLGNHEVMRMLGDYRYVSEGEYAAFRSGGSRDVRDQLFTLLVNDRKAQAKAAGTEFDEAGFKERFYTEIPLGFVEMQQAFAATGDYGKWLRERDVMVMINGIAFMHGGPSPTAAPLGCTGINVQARAELGSLTLNDPAASTSLIAGPDGPLWYRGMAGEPLLAPEQVDAIFQALGARAAVVGHTPGLSGRIGVGHGGRVFMIDTGLLDGEFYPGGVPSAIEFHRGAVTAIYLDRREPIGTTPQGQS